MLRIPRLGTSFQPGKMGHMSRISQGREGLTSPPSTRMFPPMLKDRRYVLPRGRKVENHAAPTTHTITGSHQSHIQPSFSHSQRHACAIFLGFKARHGGLTSVGAPGPSDLQDVTAEGKPDCAIDQVGEGLTECLPKLLVRQLEGHTATTTAGTQISVYSPHVVLWHSGGSIVRRISCFEADMNQRLAVL